MTSLQVAYITPLFSAGDPIVCRSIAMRPSLWTVFFSILQDWGKPGQWYQDDPTHATVQEVITEIISATDNAVLGVCLLIGQVIDLPVNAPPSWVLPCDGSIYLGSDYPELWAVIHDNLKTDGTHFRTPQRYRTIGWGEVVGATEGAETHTLTFAELPPEATNVAADYIELEAGATGFALFDIDGNGGGGAHNNIQPVEGTTLYIIAATPTAG